MTYFIASIVEGHGEVQAVPVLLRRIAAELVPMARLSLNPPLRVKAASFTNDEDYFQRYVELAARKARQLPNACVLILLDCEDGCPATLGPELLRRAKAGREQVNFIVVLASREFETWFLVAANSLLNTCGLPPGLEAPVAPEAIRDAKGWLSDQMSQPYNEPDHQPRLTAAFSIEQARSNHSFARCFNKLKGYFEAPATGAT